jgi:hypothetical protein
MPHRESRYVRIARIAYGLAQEVLPRYTHPKSPHRFTLPQLAACVLVMVYLDKSYRDMEEWLLATDAVCTALASQRVPDHSTVSRALKRLRRRDLDGMRRTLLARLPVTEDVIALDSTGSRRTQASAYSQSRQGTTFRSWAKGVYAVGTASQLILAWRQGRGPAIDSPYLNGLRRLARARTTARGRPRLRGREPSSGGTTRSSPRRRRLCVRWPALATAICTAPGAIAPGAGSTA